MAKVFEFSVDLGDPLDGLRAFSDAISDRRAASLKAQLEAQQAREDAASMQALATTTSTSTVSLGIDMDAHCVATESPYRVHLAAPTE